MWEDLICKVSTQESHERYIAQIHLQVDKRVLEDEEFMQILLSKEALQTFGEPLDGRGILGIPDLDIDFSHDIPTSHRARCRDVAQQILPIIEDHLEAYLSSGLFEPANTARYTSPIVIAKKATTSFFRIATDYRWINQYICMIQAYTPIIQHELHKSKDWEYYADIDWTEAFHQIRLSPKKSDMLSIVTTIGCMRPLFMMEGVSSASSVLQNAVSQIFGPMRKESICIFDNILTGGTKEQLRQRTKELLALCYKHNVRLNFKKSFIGHRTAKYFGYELFHNGYRIDNRRKAALEEIPFPDHGPTKKANTTFIKSFLGFSVNFSSFTENYAALAAPLHDMTRTLFDWNKDAWTRDYKADFERFKAALIASMDLIFPDFSLTWILMTDASDYAVGWVLIQLRPTPNGIVTEVISVGSEKFSTSAELQWPINEKEAYGVLRGVEANSRLLYRKDFYIATDHWNLTYQENNTSKKLSRYLLVISQFPCRGQLPLKGDINPADYMSRRDPKDSQQEIQALRDSAIPPYNPSVPLTPTDPPVDVPAPVSLTSLLTHSNQRLRPFAGMAVPGVKFDATADGDRSALKEEVTHEYDSLGKVRTPLCALQIPRRSFDWENAKPSAQVFRFTVNGQVAFQGRLQSTNCRHDTVRGPCRMRAVYGAGHCWQHLLWK